MKRGELQHVPAIPFRPERRYIVRRRAVLPAVNRDCLKPLIPQENQADYRTA